MIKAPKTKILSIINKENTMQKFIMKDGNKQGKELTICCSDVQNSHTRAKESLGIDLDIRDRANPDAGRHNDHRGNNLGGVVLAVQHPFHEADHRNHAQFGDLHKFLVLSLTSSTGPMAGAGDASVGAHGIPGRSRRS